MHYLNFNDLRAKLGGRARSSIYKDIEEGRLPGPIKLGGRLYWVETEIDTALSSLGLGSKKMSSS
ncbi:helix-turn-helix transcriptional regulator [Seohaeicola zhoushanensis]|uniref:AlpA family phage regulatory protein n=1 Tax=Seohaeicola zhoushanensis TaxID=1569283 RepID=A0A8J3H1A2_9RHOB|nr:AlpA family phage regulatory protein [Seohaeicola zhoushanensis]GHF64411.1 hypothetical protein GCM10017056_39620 [Seohaeicola zhoushanensis]